MDAVVPFALVAACVLVFFLLDRLLLWAERKGWIYWRKTKPKPDGDAILGGFFEVFQPNRTVIVAEQHRLEAGADQDNGDDKIPFPASTIRVDLPGHRHGRDAPPKR
jgi:hypothetical protein